MTRKRLLDAGRFSFKEERMNRNAPLLAAWIFGVLTTTGCAGSADDGATGETDESEDALTTSLKSAYPFQCPGRGWSNSVTNWDKVRGTYARTTFAPFGEPSWLTIVDDPSAQNQGKPAYTRTINWSVDTGKVMLGLDNPAIGPMMAFEDANEKMKDIYYVLDQRRSAAGKITAICLGKAAGADGSSTPNSVAFMMKRFGR